MLLIGNVNAQIGLINPNTSNNEATYETNPNLPEVIIEPNGTECNRLRPGIWEFDQAQRIEIRNCMMAYLNSGNNSDWQSSDPREESNFIVF